MVGAAIAALLATLALAGCATTTPPPISSAELASARTFPYYTTYWVGPIFEHHPLTAADGVAGYVPAVGDSVYYGDCIHSNGILGGGGCMLPLQVTTLIYTLHSNSTLNPQRNVLIRGVPAVVYDQGRSIELYSGRVEIEVFSDSYSNALAAARQLRPLNHSGSDEVPLPPPVYCPLLSGPQSIALQLAMARLPGHPCQRAEAALARKEMLQSEP